MVTTIVVLLLIISAVILARHLGKSGKPETESQNPVSNPQRAVYAGKVKRKTAAVATDYVYHARDGRDYTVYITGTGKFYMRKLNSKGMEYIQFFRSNRQKKYREQFIKDNPKNKIFR